MKWTVSDSYHHLGLICMNSSNCIYCIEQISIKPFYQVYRFNRRYGPPWRNLAEALMFAERLADQYNETSNSLEFDSIS